MQVPASLAQTNPVHWLVAGLVLAVSGAANAASKVFVCDGCNAEHASAAAVSTKRSGRVYVADRVTHTLRAYDVLVDARSDPPDRVAAVMSPPLTVAGFFDELMRAYRSASTERSARVPGSIVPSAHRLVGYRQGRHRVGEWLLRDYFPEPADWDTTEVRDEVLEGRHVEVVFADYSTATLKLRNYFAGESNYEFVDDSLFGAQGNPIPDRPSDIGAGDSGRFTAAGLGGLGTRDAYVRTLHRLGIRTSGAAVSGTGGSCVAYACLDATGGVECRFSWDCGRPDRLASYYDYERACDRY